MMKKQDKKKKRNGDLILIAVVTMIAAILFAIAGVRKAATEKGRVIVYLDQEAYQSFSLTQDMETWIETGNGDGNLLKIQNGKVSIIDANCRDHICMKQGEISGNGESIICLPHRLTIMIENDVERELDAITR